MKSNGKNSSKLGQMKKNIQSTIMKQNETKNKLNFNVENRAKLKSKKLNGQNVKPNERNGKLHQDQNLENDDTENDNQDLDSEISNSSSFLVDSSQSEASEDDDQDQKSDSIEMEKIQSSRLSDRKQIISNSEVSDKILSAMRESNVSSNVLKSIETPFLNQDNQEDDDEEALFWAEESDLTNAMTKPVSSVSPQKLVIAVSGSHNSCVKSPLKDITNISDQKKANDGKIEDDTGMDDNSGMENFISKTIHSAATNKLELAKLNETKPHAVESVVINIHDEHISKSKQSRQIFNDFVFDKQDLEWSKKNNPYKQTLRLNCDYANKKWSVDRSFKFVSNGVLAQQMHAKLKANCQKIRDDKALKIQKNQVLGSEARQSKTSHSIEELFTDNPSQNKSLHSNNELKVELPPKHKSTAAATVSLFPTNGNNLSSSTASSSTSDKNLSKTTSTASSSVVFDADLANTDQIDESSDVFRWDGLKYQFTHKGKIMTASQANSIVNDLLPKNHDITIDYYSTYHRYDLKKSNPTHQVGLFAENKKHCALQAKTAKQIEEKMSKTDFEHWQDEAIANKNVKSKDPRTYQMYTCPRRYAAICKSRTNKKRKADPVADQLNDVVEVDKTFDKKLRSIQQSCSTANDPKTTSQQLECSNHIKPDDSDSVKQFYNQIGSWLSDDMKKMFQEQLESWIKVQYNPSNMNECQEFLAIFLSPGSQLQQLKSSNSIALWNQFSAKQGDEKMKELMKYYILFNDKARNTVMKLVYEYAKKQSD